MSSKKKKKINVDKSSQTSLEEKAKNVERQIVKSFSQTVKKFTEELDKGNFSKTNKFCGASFKNFFQKCHGKNDDFKEKLKEKFFEAKDHVKFYTDDLSIIMLVIAIETKENVGFMIDEAKPYLEILMEQGKIVGKGFARKAGKILHDIKEEISL